MNDDQLKEFENLVSLMFYSQRAYYSIVDIEFYLEEINKKNNFDLRPTTNKLAVINYVADDMASKISNDVKLYNLFLSKEAVERIQIDINLIDNHYLKDRLELLDQLAKVMKNIYEAEDELIQKIKNDDWRNE